MIMHLAVLLELTVRRRMRRRKRERKKKEKKKYQQMKVRNEFSSSSSSSSSCSNQFCFMSQMIMNLSAETDNKNMPLGWNVTPLTQLSWPSKVCSSCSVITSHTFTLLSRLTDAREEEMVTWSLCQCGDERMQCP